MDTIGRVWRAKAHAKVRPRSSTRGPKMRKNEFFEILEGKTHIFTRFWMVNLADSRSPWGVLGALGGVLGGPWEVQSRLWEGSGGSQGTGHRTWRLQGGVWEPTSATPKRVHIHKTHIFVRYFDYLENRRFLHMPQQIRWSLSFGGVGSAPCGPFGPPGECANFFLSSRGPLWSGQSSHHGDF